MLKVCLALRPEMLSLVCVAVKYLALLTNTLMTQDVDMNSLSVERPSTFLMLREHHLKVT
jgi:hypothetical protein